jgi:tetratricopeptide (TPR) repeat protein
MRPGHQVTKSSSHKRRTVVVVLIFSFIFIYDAYARTEVENLQQVEKLFMEAKYERVVVEAGKLIDASAHGREELFYLKGLSLMQLNRFNESRQDLEYMIERYPRGKRTFDGYIGIGDSYFLENKFNEAIVAYNNALKSFPDHKNSATAYYKIGSSYQRLGINDKANEYFSKVRSASPLSFESKMITKEVSRETEKPNTEDYYYVQAGYFKTKANANNLNEKLRRKGYESYIATLLKSNTEFYRVKVGHFKYKEEAEAFARKMTNDGFKTKVCR